MNSIPWVLEYWWQFVYWLLWMVSSESSQQLQLLEVLLQTHSILLLLEPANLFLRSYSCRFQIGLPWFPVNACWLFWDSPVLRSIRCTTASLCFLLHRCLYHADLHVFGDLEGHLVTCFVSHVFMGFWFGHLVVLSVFIWRFREISETMLQLQSSQLILFHYIFTTNTFIWGKSNVLDGFEAIKQM